MRSWRYVSAVVYLVASVATIGHAQESVPVLLSVSNQPSQVAAGLAWFAEPGRTFDVFSTTNLLSGHWSTLNAQPIAPTGLVGEAACVSPDPVRFFRVAARDTAAPAIVDAYPGTYAVGVGRFATLAVELQDGTGVETNRLALAIGGQTYTNGSHQVFCATNLFRYAPGTTPWGDYGATVTVSFARSDVLGNTATSAWSFVLEVEPVLAGNLLHIGPSQPLKGNAARPTAVMPPGGAPVPLLEGLTILAFETNRIEFAYAGEAHGLYVGAILISHDPDLPFYRRILSLDDDLPNHRVTAWTEDVPLTELIQEGSFSSEGFVPLEGAQAIPLWQDTVQVGIPFNYEGHLTVAPIERGNVRIRPGDLDCTFRGDLRICCQFEDWDVTAFGAKFESDLYVGLRAGVDFFEKVELLGETVRIADVTLGRVWGFVGVVPVWIDVQLALDFGYSVGAEAAISLDTGLDAYAQHNYSLDWTPETGLVKTAEGGWTFVPVPIELGFEVKAEAWVFARPSLNALVYSVAGVGIDFKRGPALEVKLPVEQEQFEFTLKDKWSLGGGLVIEGIDEEDLPHVTFMSGWSLIDRWYYPPLPESAPKFLIQPTNVTVLAGTGVLLESSATGSPNPEYQWFQNGKALPFQTGATIGFVGSAQSAGSYRVEARNSVTTTASAVALVTVTNPASGTPPPPFGMVVIPGGSFQMGDCVGDSVTEGFPEERPVHTVQVNDFVMARYEVSKVQWDTVASWAIAHGYDISPNSGSAKASNHPVQDVTWFECVKWCNAKSEQENLSPCYRHNGALYRSGGDVSVTCDWSADGYRLPTEAEWERAARGGVAGRRFPWGATISHANANYLADSVAYDTNGYDDGTRWHPTYNDGIEPYTSPVGSFGPNTFGLYDVAGNVWEWCWDWFSSRYYTVSPGNNPLGAASGSTRTVRGGCWEGSTTSARLARRTGYGPALSYRHLGFRPVRRMP